MIYLTKTGRKEEAFMDERQRKRQRIMRARRRRRKRMIRHTIYACMGIGLALGILILAGKIRNCYSEAVIAMQGDQKLLLNGENKLEEEHVFTVCIDAGHGGKDIGANSGNRLEKDDTLEFALELKEKLEQKDIRVVMTRETDDFLKLSDRNQIANDAQADYFISIHRNSGKGNGVEEWINAYPDQEAQMYAEAILSNLDAIGISGNRGVKKGTQDDATEDYAINRDSNMPSVILELGFVNSQTDNELLDQNLDSYAEAICEGIWNTWQEIQTESYETE
jgi:N-acetylmuramoyl-L-alanine amidase